jgi:adenine-specific DNA-methyltransferase
VYGEVFTRRWVVEAILDLVRYNPCERLDRLRLVEPSCGRGAFLLPAVERLLRSVPVGRRTFEDLAPAIRAYDLNGDNVSYCRGSVRTMLEAAGISSANADALAGTWIRHDDYLLGSESRDSLWGQLADVDKVDVVIGNPPYIRLEHLPSGRSNSYRARWRTMSGRADIYIGFYERALTSLRPGGRLGFICADRWMRNQYGAELRRLVAGSYSVDAVWSMHAVDAFEAQVDAYPAITILSRRAQGTTVVADTTGNFDADAAQALVEWTLRGDCDATAQSSYVAHRLPHWFPGGEHWPAGDPGRLALIEQLNDNFPPLQDSRTRTRVGIGVATGADQVFITGNPKEVEPERLLPLAMVADTRGGNFTWSGKYLVNPWEPDGNLVDLQVYPRLRAHFHRHRQVLRGRYVAKARPTAWHRTIDKVAHDLTAKPKLLIADMRTAMNPVLDCGGHYPHHNLYYVVSDVWDLEVLGGLLLSRVAQVFVEAYCVRMRNNTLRFQAQYLRKIRVPYPGNVEVKTQQSLRAAFIARDVEAATAAALEAYGLDPGVLTV